MFFSIPGGTKDPTVPVELKVLGWMRDFSEFYNLSWTEEGQKMPPQSKRFAAFIIPNKNG